MPQAQIPAVVAAATELKTGALMEFAARLTALVASAPPERVELLAAVGRNLGMVLQMLDDLGSITSEARWNKGKEDLLGDRPTWPWAWLASHLDSDSFSQLQAQARDIRGSAESAHRVAEVMGNLLGQRGHEHIDPLVSATMVTLSQGTRDNPSVAAAERIFRRMHDSYG